MVGTIASPVCFVLMPRINNLDSRSVAGYASRMRHLLALSLLLLAFPAGAADYSARVVGIADGDTITVLTEARRQVKVRLHGIDAPETGQDFGARAKQAASSLAFGKHVTIRERDRDRYGRTVADVILPDGRSMNRELVRQGMAWCFRRYAPADTELARLEAEARKARVGLWSQPNPIPPWSWRRGDGAPLTATVVGNRRSQVYHKPTCRGAATTAEKNRITFASEADAEKAGYRKARDCW
jgi:endonuclease YncB( thermonuclease family)